MTIGHGRSKFQSTLPAREATGATLMYTLKEWYFNPRFPRGKRQFSGLYPPQRDNFNPRFPRGKRRRKAIWRRLPFDRFQSTLPAREATRTWKKPTKPFGQFQSTLPAREATIDCIIRARSITDFNPRFPRGKRLISWGSRHDCPQISIHASREGSDWEEMRLTKRKNNFNPRFPRGKRRGQVQFFYWQAAISIHASREGSDSTVKLSPDDRTSRHGFREPGFLRFRHRQISCLFLLGAWGSRL